MTMSALRRISPDTADDFLLTVPEVARFFNVTPYTIRVWLSDGKLKGSKPGGKYWRIELKEVRRLAKEKYSDGN